MIVYSMREKFLPNEHFYSLWIRMCVRSGFALSPLSSVMKKKGIPAHQMQPQRVLGKQTNAMIKMLYGSGQAAEDVMLLATVMNFWRLCSTGSLSEIVASATVPRPNNEHAGLAFTSGWQLCPKCAAEDKEMYGVSYWHRDHQVPSTTHCLIHQEPLVTHESLRYFREFLLPQHCIDMCDVPAGTERLYGWSKYLLGVDRFIRNEPEQIVALKKVVTELLAIPEVVKQKHREGFNVLLSTLEQDVGGELLNHLFRFYRDGRETRHNILWTTFSGKSTAKLIRHPIYWLVIIYWLRDALASQGFEFDQY